PSLVARLAQERPARRRRLAALLCERLGLAPERADGVLAQLPARPVALAEAAFRFAVTLEIAGAPRVLGRAAYERMNARFGADAVAFALARRGLVRAAPDAGRGEAEAEAVVARAPDLLVDTLAASDHPLAGPVAAILARPQPLRGALVDAFARDPGRLAVALDAIETARVQDEQLVSRAASRPADPAPPVEDETVAFAPEPEAAPREAASG
ncbi:hypothetical protein ACTZWW_21980, partial [Salinarimonas sp. NSM]|uniref:hypothetical protein n=1 Tax=Salinarimonas sp. NSM TaxID=3458003 RepID=UPI0040370C8D